MTASEVLGVVLRRISLFSGNINSNKEQQHMMVFKRTLYFSRELSNIRSINIHPRFQLN